MKNKLKFRTILYQKDAENIRKIAKSTGFFEAASDEIDSAVNDFLEAFLAGETSDYKYIFLDLDEKTIGFISYMQMACCDRLFLLDWMAVDNAFRGQGYGKILMLHALNLLKKEKNARKAILVTSGRADYLPTRKFHESCGFKVTAEIPDYYSKGESAVYFSQDFE